MAAEPESPEVPATSVRRTAVSSLASYGIPVVIGLVAMPVAFRVLGAPRFGVLSMVLLAPGLASSLDLGLSSTAVRRFAELDQRDVRLGAAYATFLGLMMVIGGLLAAAVALLAPALADLLGMSDVTGSADATALIRLTALWMWLTLALSAPGLMLRARQRFAQLAIVQSAAALALWAAIVVLAAAGAGLLEIAIAAVAIGVLGSIACFLLARRDLPAAGLYRFEPGIVLGDLRFASGLFMIQLSSLLAVQVDRLFVAALASPAAAGVYALCVGVANKTLFAVSALTSFAFPRAATLQGRGRTLEIGELLRALQRVAVVVVVPTIAPAMLLAGPFLSLWLGTASVEPVVLLQLLWIGYAIAACCAPATHVIVGTGESRLAAAFAWLTAALLIAGMFLAVPRSGLAGAGVANLVALSSALLFLVVVRRRLAVPSDPQRGRIAVGLVIGCAAQLALLLPLAPRVDSWSGFILLGAASLAAFQSVRWALSLLSPEEARLIESLLHRFR